MGEPSIEFDGRGLQVRECAKRGRRGAWSGTIHKRR